MRDRVGAAYPTVGTVCPSSLLGGLVDLDTLDDQVSRVQTLGIGVGLGVLEQAEQELGRLDGPAGARDAKLLACEEYRVSALLNLVMPPPLVLSGCLHNVLPHRSLLLLPCIPHISRDSFPDAGA